MNTKVLLATLAGAVATFLSGWLLYGMALKGFFDAQVVDTARGAMRTAPLLWSIFIGCVAWALLLAMIFTKWAGIATFQNGAMAGLWIGFLLGLGADFFSYGGMNVTSMTGCMVDIIVTAIQGAISGGFVGWVLGTGSK